MKKFLSISLFLMSMCFVSCNNDEEVIDNASNNEVVELVGTQEYLSNIKTLVGAPETRTVTEDEDSIVPLIIEESIEYLNANKINYKEFFEDDSDPRIAVFAMGIVEIEKTSELAALTRTTVFGCALEALGVKDLATKGLTKAAIKALGKAAAKKAIPYVGWGLFAVDMGLCLTE